MPGAYAHITLVNHYREPARLEGAGLHVDAITSVLDYFKFCELGSVSPDYPYLVLSNKKPAEWSDAMHYTNTGAVIQAGVQRVREMAGESKRKCLAWLLGYAAHVTTDVTIHPVVELKVGPYHGNEDAHRKCEMHQDAYIYRRLNLGDIGIGEHLDSGLRKCGVSDELDDDVASLWIAMLNDVYADGVRRNAPEPRVWHQWFCKVVDNIAEEGGRLLPFARHLAADAAVVYPAEKEIDMQYIKSLSVPGGVLDYDDIFDKTVENVGVVWKWIADAVFEGGQDYMIKLGNWNLDTGRDQGDDKLVFWS